MTSALVRGKYVVCKVVGANKVEVVENGAVLHRDGTIVDVGSYEKLMAEHSVDEVIGTPEHIVLPGFVNSHHHVGLTPFQLGSPDEPLELWIAYRMASRDVDPYLDTLYSAFEMIESGVTTVQHLHGRALGPTKRIHRTAEEIIRAYRDVGMRVSYSFGIKDRNRLVYGSDEEFVQGLPDDISSDIGGSLKAQAIDLEDFFSVFEDLHGIFREEQRVKIQLAASNLHCCTDRALAMTKDYAARFGVPVHLHVLETPLQKEYARRRADATPVQVLDEFGLLGPDTTLGHCVWVTEDDIELIAKRGACICHLPSSNLRLRSGTAPLNVFQERGIRVAIGMDEAGINDDRDIFQEMRLALDLHRVPGFDGAVPTPSEVFQMATENGAFTTPYQGRIGTIEPGRSADFVLMRWKDIAYPYLDPAVPVVDAVVRRGKPRGVDTVVVNGEVIFRDSRFTRIDKNEALEALAASLHVPKRPDEERRFEVGRKVIPHIRRFYADYPSCPAHAPFYWVNSRQ